jgi:hypothetical protein
VIKQCINISLLIEAKQSMEERGTTSGVADDKYRLFDLDSSEIGK